MSRASTAAAAAPSPADPVPVSFGEALGTAIDAARRASPVHASPDGRLFLAQPEGYKLTELPDQSLLPPWPKARVEVDDRASLVAYVNRFAGPATILIADYDALAVAARLDWHPDNQDAAWGRSGAGAHSAVLQLRASEEFKRWDAVQGKLHPQAEFAAFLEENSVDIVHPDAATMIEISRDLEATTAQSFRSSVRLENGDRRFVFTTETQTPADVVIPREFTLQIPLYLGEAPETLRAAFRFRATPSGLMLGFEWRRVEYQRQAHFAAIATRAAEDTGRPVVFGRIRG